MVFQPAPVDTAGVLGQSAFLNCSVDDITVITSRADTLLWEKVGGTPSQIFNSNTGIKDENYLTMYRVEGQYNLIMQNIQKEHGAQYKCHIINEAMVSVVSFTVLGNISIFFYFFISSFIIM